jgi:hypothetical protein
MASRHRTRARMFGSGGPGSGRFRRGSQKLHQKMRRYAKAQLGTKRYLALLKTHRRKRRA